MAIKTISQFDTATPTSNDKILFEQNGEGKSTTIGNAVNTCSLTQEEIQATTNLAGKVAGADSIKNLINNRVSKIKIFWNDSSDKDYVVFKNVPIGYREGAIVVGNGNNTPVFRYCALFMNGTANSSEQTINSGTISITDNGDGTADITVGSVNQWGRYNLIVFYG